ncbi:substrate-binding periplasmic protein [Shewanella donghaensis]|uniref:substrate-binding periplasmic protein n=1 Tax=Shewanella donghaensis TaxID=238836 RepID=UPI001182731E|nr:transporter substrate-binding domain-containing protein [Shewanella donghaensis]
MSGSSMRLITLLITLSLCLFITELKAEKITVYTYQNAPFAEQTDNNHRGMIIEIVAELFTRAELDYEVVFNPLKRGLTMTARSPNVCVLPIERTQQRESDFVWVGPVLISRYGLFSDTKNSIPLVTLHDAREYSIGTFLGSGISEYLVSFSHEVQLTSADNLNLKKLQKGRIDLWAAELITAKSIMMQTNIRLGEPELIYHTSLRAMACNKGLEKVKHRALMDGLKSMYQDGFMQKINTAYGVSL